MSGRQFWILGALILAVGAVEIGKRTGWDDRLADASRTNTTATQPTSTKPYVWKVTIDPSGRPYDEPLTRGSRIERRPLTVLHAPSRRVLFMGGEYLLYADRNEAKAVTLAERRGRRYRVDAIWKVYKKERHEEIVGVVIVERDIPVVRWRELHPVAYGTDGGTGGITTAEWADRPESERREYELTLDGLDGEAEVYDIDGFPGIDTIEFHNGFGDGGFPSVAGYDASGARAAIVLWTIVVPWRLAFPEGKPPWQVTRRENEFAACLAGRRKIEGSRCRIVR